MGISFTAQRNKIIEGTKTSKHNCYKRGNKIK